MPRNFKTGLPLAMARRETRCSPTPEALLQLDAGSRQTSRRMVIPKRLCMRSTAPGRPAPCRSGPGPSPAVRTLCNSNRGEKSGQIRSANQKREIYLEENGRARRPLAYTVKKPMRSTRRSSKYSPSRERFSFYCTPRGQMRRARRDHASARVDPAEARATSIPVRYSCLFSPM